MSAFSDTQGFGASHPPEPPRARDGFWAQTPAAVLAIAAVSAILFVNNPERPTSSTAVNQPAPAVKAAADAPARPEAAPAPADCADCAIVLSVQQLQGTGDSGFAIEVKMQDGTRRTVRHFAAGFEAGDAVIVNGNALTLRSADKR